MNSPAHAQAFPNPPALVRNAEAGAPILLLCDHASNEIPDAFANLGLGCDQLDTHIAFDPGASLLTAAMAEALDAAYVLCRYSRLLIDVNRDPSAPDSIVADSDGVRIPGNETLPAPARSARIAHIYEPYHQAVADVLRARAQASGTQLVISVHSFTPRMHGIERPWDIGVIFNRDRRVARALAGELVGAGSGAGLTVGFNRPYSPRDRVYHTLERHAEAGGLPCVMIELPNDQLDAPADRKRWADSLAGALRRIAPAFVPGGGASRDGA